MVCGAQTYLGGALTVLVDFDWYWVEARRVSLGHVPGPRRQKIPRQPFFFLHKARYCILVLCPQVGTPKCHGGVAIRWLPCKDAENCHKHAAVGALQNTALVRIAMLLGSTQSCKTILGWIKCREAVLPSTSKFLSPRHVRDLTMAQ